LNRAVDVAIIGGGIAGTSTAALLAEAGLSVRLYERSAIAAGASGRNSGIVQHPFDPVLADLYRRSVAEYRRVERMLGDRDGDGEGDGAAAFRLPERPAGLLFLGRDASLAASAASTWAAAWPETAPTRLDGAALLKEEPALAPDLVACRLEIGYPVAPASATEAFADVARRAGAGIVIGDVARLATDDGRAIGVAVGGRVEPAGQVVVAAGPWTPGIVEPSGGWRPIRPVWGVVASVALDAAPRHGLEALDIDVEPRDSSRGRDSAAAEPGDRGPGAVDFSLVPGTSGSALGSTFLPDEPDPARWVDALRRVGARYVPGVATAPLLGLRHCARPVSADGRPLIGRVPWIDDAWVIAGHGPWGISTGPGSAAALADELLGRRGEIPDALAVGRFGEPSAHRQELGENR
jgi:glycine/D-amino acid oxidase-like deaminating enzyme